MTGQSKRRQFRTLAAEYSNSKITATVEIIVGGPVATVAGRYVVLFDIVVNIVVDIVIVDDGDVVVLHVSSAPVTAPAAVTAVVGRTGWISRLNGPACRKRRQQRVTSIACSFAFFFREMSYIPRSDKAAPMTAPAANPTAASP